jgi:hypothetical protein
MSYPSLDAISDEEWDRTFDIKIGAMFRTTGCGKAYEARCFDRGHLVDQRRPLQSWSYRLRHHQGRDPELHWRTRAIAREKGIRANCMAPGPIWMRLIPPTMSAEKVARFGEQVPIKRSGQPAELAAAYVVLASDEASHISGATIAVTVGAPII